MKWLSSFSISLPLAKARSICHKKFSKTFQQLFNNFSTIFQQLLNNFSTTSQQLFNNFSTNGADGPILLIFFSFDQTARLMSFSTFLSTNHPRTMEELHRGWNGKAGVSLNFTKWAHQDSMRFWKFWKLLRSCWKVVEKFYGRWTGL